MKSNFIENPVTENKSKWLSADELRLLGPLPTSIAGLHLRARNQHWEKRKKEGVKGGKAVEYNIYTIPEPERSLVLSKLGLAVEAPASVTQGQAYWNAIFVYMTPEQQSRALKIFNEGGLKDLMPKVLEDAAEECVLDGGSSGCSEAAASSEDEPLGRKKVG